MATQRGSVTPQHATARHVSPSCSFPKGKHHDSTHPTQKLPILTPAGQRAKSKFRRRLASDTPITIPGPAVPLASPCSGCRICAGDGMFSLLLVQPGTAQTPLDPSAATAKIDGR